MIITLIYNKLHKMYRILNLLKKHITFSILLFGSLSCANESTDLEQTNNSLASTEISNLQHISFYTPEWNKFIDCSLLDFQPLYQNDSTSYINASSASTNQSFYFTYPSDSATMVNPSNIKKYSVRLYGAHEGYFEFSQKLPYTDGNVVRLISEYGFSDSIYNQIVSIKYIDSKASMPRFEIKGRYAMLAYVLNTSDYSNTSNKRKITGTYNIKVSVSRK